MGDPQLYQNRWVASHRYKYRYRYPLHPDWYTHHRHCPLGDRSLGPQVVYILKDLQALIPLSEIVYFHYHHYLYKFLPR